MNRRPTFSLINCYHYHCDHYCCYYFHNQQQQLHHHYLRNKSVSLDLPCPPPNHVVTYRGGKSQDTLCWNSVDVNGFLFLSLEQVGKQALHASPPANKSARQFLILSIHSASLSSLSLSLSSCWWRQKTPRYFRQHSHLCYVDLLVDTWALPGKTERDGESVLNCCAAGPCVRLQPKG